MNKKMLARLLWKQIFLNPDVLSIFPPLPRMNRPHLKVRRWPWLVTNYSREGLSLQLLPSAHLLQLPFDSIVSFQENVRGRPSFLLLKSQVFITAAEVFLEPVPQWRPGAPLRVSLPF